MYSGIDPWGRYKEPMKFYTPKGLIIRKSENPQMLRQVLNSNEYKNYKFLYLTNNFLLEEDYKNLKVKFTRSYLSLPEWVANINFNNWLVRTTVFNLYEVSIPPTD